MPPTVNSSPPETTIAVAWPSVASMRLGRALGRCYQLGPRVSVAGIPFRPGWLIALLSIPVAVVLYLAKVVPRRLVVLGPSNPLCRRYRLTTKRVLVEHPFDALSTSRRDRSLQASVPLEQCDAIDIQVQPGYQWYRAGDLVLRHEGTEVLRLPAVPHPETFRQTCLKAIQSYRGVQAARAAAIGPTG